MIRAFKTFWKDYWDLCKHSMDWFKKHWIGYTILTTILVTIEMVVIFWDNVTEWFNDLTDKIKEKFN